MNSTNLDVQAFSEVKCILDFLPKHYTEKLPLKLLNIIDSLYDERFKVDIKPNIELKNQKFTEDTKNIIAVLKYNYWCVNNEEKEKLAKMFEENEKKYQEKLREKYNPDNIFSQKEISIEEQKEQSNCIQMVEYKETLFKRIVNKIFQFFRKN